MLIKTGIQNAMVIEKVWKDCVHDVDCKVVYKFWKDKFGDPMVTCFCYENGKRISQLIDNNCDVYDEMNRNTSKEDGNNFWKWLTKPGREFKRVK